ncbi:hypothetical protein Aduo_014331 [Ancylostoma duodenale]
METRFATAILVFCGLLAFLGYTLNRGRLKEVNVSRSVDNSAHIKYCVPHYSLLLQEKDRAMGDHRDPDTAFTLMASYNYGNYSVITTQAKGVLGKKVYCRYFLYINIFFQEEMEPAVESFIFPENAVYCCSRDKTRYMSVTENLKDPFVEYIPIVNRRLKRPKYFLSLCLSPMYGDERKWLFLAELVEHNKLQGVEYFYIYVKDMDDYTNELITHYVRNGLAEVVPFHKDNDRVGKQWQHAYLQDCIQRSRGHSKYVIIQDVDERILPADNLTFRKLIRETMKTNKTIAMVSFPTLEFMMTLSPPLEYRGNNTLDLYLPTLVYHKNRFTGRMPKCAIDPTKVLVMWNSSASVLFPGYIEHHLTTQKVIMRRYSGVGIQGNPDLTSLNVTAFPTGLMSTLYSKVEETLNQVYGKGTN